MSICHAVLLDTVSIQKYIFQSNKLKENLGASYLVREIYRNYLACAVCRVTGRSPSEEHGLLDDWKRSDADKPDCSKPVDVGYIGGGNALLFFGKEAAARQFIEEWTKVLLIEAPGLTTAVALDSFPESPSEFQSGLQKLFKQLEFNKARFNPITSLSRHGITSECTHSGISAELFNKIVKNYVSSGVNARLEAATKSKEEIEKEYRDQGIMPKDFCFSNELEDLGGLRGEDSHIAIVHIDGNDIGELFKQARDLKAIRKLSVQIDEVTTAAFKAIIETVCDISRYSAVMKSLGFNPDSTDSNTGVPTEHRMTEESLSRLKREAAFPGRYLDRLRNNMTNRGFGSETKFIKAMQDELKEKLDDEFLEFSSKERDLLIAHAEKRKILPIRPIIISGDDVTFVCDGKLGIYFAKIFMKRFQESRIDGFGVLSSCAGVAIIKTKYPFYRGYRLAEELCAGAKKKRKDESKWNEASVLDFQVSLGGVAGSLEEVRKRHYGRNSSEDDRRSSVDLLYRPFKILSRQSSDEHDLDMFLEKVRELNDEKTGLPKNKRHELREVLRLPEHARREYVQALEYRGRKLPIVAGRQYHKTLVENNETPYFDMLEMRRFYPIDLEENGDVL